MPRPMLPNRRAFAAALSLLPLLSVPLLGQAQASDLRWTDARRQRSLPLRLRRPLQANGALVLFSHGLGGNLDAGTFWAEAWVQAGFTVLHLQHPGSDAEVLRQGGLRNGLQALVEAANATQLQARADDVRFVLDEIGRLQQAGEPGFEGLRTQAIGLAGHSFGAHTTLALAGQQFGPLGAALQDPRPRAFAAFSPSPGARGSEAEAGSAFGGIRRPVLCLSGSLDADPLNLDFSPGASRPRARRGERETHTDARSHSGHWRRAVYDALPAGDKAELWLDAADHMSFSGQALGRWAERLRPRDPATQAREASHRALIAATTTRWWQAQLLDDAAARATLPNDPAGLQPGDAWRRS